LVGLRRAGKQRPRGEELGEDAAGGPDVRRGVVVGGPEKSKEEKEREREGGERVSFFSLSLF
jgi:hypothetical protein